MCHFQELAGVFWGLASEFLAPLAETRTSTYDAYGNLTSETLLGSGKTHLLTELYDAFGRSLGYTYAKDGSVQQTVGTSYDAASGRIATASFLHGGAAKTFSYNYLAGTPLLASLACPSNLTIEHAYEAGRDLVAGITIRRGAGTNVVLRNYTYDTLARPLTRSTSRNGATQNDTFGYNSRSELVSATLGNDNYSYAFDAIGNRATSSEAGTELAYAANNLNQYTGIASSESSASFAFNPTYDADGNATLIRTSTGTWTIAYNAENRPVRFENAGMQTVVECGYDSQGRRFEKKVTVAGTTMLHHRYIYRGYLQIAALDLTRAAHPALWLVTWDPSQPTATRPLALQKDGTWFTYGYDLTKNVCELFGPNGYIRTAYSYTPFGSVSASENGVVQPFQWSSEFYDSELDLVYYNYRHYSPSLGRFLSRDPIAEQGGLNLYSFVRNDSYISSDTLGLLTYVQADGNFGHAWIRTGDIEFLTAVVDNVHYIALVPKGIGFYPINDESKLTYLFTKTPGAWTNETAKELGLALDLFTATEYSLKQIKENDMLLQYGAKMKCKCTSEADRSDCLISILSVLIPIIFFFPIAVKRHRMF